MYLYRNFIPYFNQNIMSNVIIPVVLKGLRYRKSVIFNVYVSMLQTIHYIEITISAYVKPLA